MHSGAIRVRHGSCGKVYAGWISTRDRGREWAQTDAIRIQEVQGLLFGVNVIVNDNRVTLVHT